MTVNNTLKSWCSVCYVPRLRLLLDHISIDCTLEVYRLKKSPQFTALSHDTVLQKKSTQVQSSVRGPPKPYHQNWTNQSSNQSKQICLIAPGHLSVALCHMTMLRIVGISSDDRPHKCRLLRCGLTGGRAVGHSTLSNKISLCDSKVKNGSGGIGQELSLTLTILNLCLNLTPQKCI